MFCPECKSEFREGITECPDDQVALVPELPEVSHEMPDLVAVFESTDPADLLAAQSALDGAGIPYQTGNPGAVPGTSFGGSLDPAGETALLLVPRERAEEATELLAGDAAAGGDEEE